jgi:RNase P/RNase MRP subunit p29|tara:strand:+ start:321 stop:488 length:168 start_codon:yes stop_codon:yes gene_type:complete
MATYREIFGQAIKVLASDPSASAATEGQVWYNSTSNTFKIVVDDGGYTVKTITTS